MYKYFALHSDLSHHAFIPVLACVIPTAVLVCLSFGNKTVLVCLSFGNKGVTVATVAKVHLSTPITKQSTQNTPNHHKETGTIPTISFSLKTHFLGTENHATKPRKKNKTKKQRKKSTCLQRPFSLSLSLTKVPHHTERPVLDRVTSLSVLTAAPTCTCPRGTATRDRPPP